MSTSRVLKYLFVLSAVFAVAACQSAQTRSANAVVSRQVTDDLGRTVTVPADIRRVVSLAPSLTEVIYAAGAGDRLVGVTTFCNYPDEAKSIAKIGDTMTPNMETIVALKPDVVFVSTASQIESFTKTLDNNGIAVYVTDPQGIEGVIKDLHQLGQLFGTSKTADDLTAKLQQRVDAVKEAVVGKPPVRVFVQISREPLFTVGKQSFLTSIIELAGGHSVTADVDTAYPKLSKETASALKPDAIVLSMSDDNQVPNEVFRNSPAVRSGRILNIDADILSRPGPRLVDALEQIARTLHSPTSPD